MDGGKRRTQKKKGAAVGTEWIMPNNEGMRGSGDRGEWMQDSDERGRVYYWHTKTMETRWDKPEAFGVVAATAGEGGNAVRLHDLGGPGRELPKDVLETIQANADGEDGEEFEEQMFYYNSTYCVLERDLSKGSQGSWRICKI